MARRKESGLDLIAGVPWPFGVVLGIAAYLGIRYGIGWYFSTNGGPLLKQVGQQLSDGLYAPLAWMALALCWIAAFVSYVKSRQRKKLLDTRTGLESLKALSWREFEMLVGEAFRRQGYVVEETGLGGSDGGIDLVLYKGGRKTLVQCKQWQARQVNVPTVREMWGLANHHDADDVKIVCVGDFTRDATEFATGKPIALITGQRLLELVRTVQVSTPAVYASQSPHSPHQETIVAPECPRCGSEMALRKNRRTGQPFWGCQHFPRCKETLGYSTSNVL